MDEIRYQPDLYEEFADRYDLFFREFGKHDDRVVQFYRELFERHHVHNVLDCACGTGHDLVMLHGLRCEATGSDVSESMLKVAGRNLSGLGLDVPLHKADYRDLVSTFGRRFGAVLCLSSSILHMPDDAQVVRAFRSMHDVLLDGGILVVTQGTTDKQWKEKPVFIVAVDLPDFTRIFAVDYVGAGARYNVLDVFKGRNASTLKTWSVDYSHMILRDDMHRLLGIAGFARVDFYGTYAFEPYDKASSNLLIAVAHR